MPNASYQKGYRAELELVHKARAAGCAAQRSPGSKGAFDVYVTAPGGTSYLINVKVNDWAPPHERAALWLCVSPHSEAVLARRDTGGPWAFRIVREDGSMGIIVSTFPWQSTDLNS